MERYSSKRYITFLLVNIAVLIWVGAFSLSAGRYSISLSEIAAVLTNESRNPQHYTLFYQIRLPRVVLVTLCGGALALGGTVFQKLFRNPLASPDVVGVTSGCSLGAVCAIVLFKSTGTSMQFLSFIFGIAAMALVLSFARLVSINKSLGIIISGIVISSLCSSFIMLLKYIADPYKQLASIEFWMMGGFALADWQQIAAVLPTILISSLILYLLRWKLNVISLGYEQALSLGIRVKPIRLICLTAATLLVSSVVSVAGLVNWIGLLAPHVVRLYCDDDMTKSVPLSFITGGILLLVADTASRILTASELPISIITSLVGAPLLLYLAWKRGRG